MLSNGVDEVALRLGDVVGGILSNTFRYALKEADFFYNSLTRVPSNAAQLISSILLLKSRQVQVLQSMLVGSILSNLLLMTGLSFFFGGIGRLEQFFNVALARTISMLLLLAVLALVIPTASHMLTNTSPHDIMIQSRGTSVVIMLSYALWLFFQLKTNRSMFDVPPASSARTKGDLTDEDKKGLGSKGDQKAENSGEPDKPEKPEEEENESQLGFYVAIATIAICATLLGFNIEFATNSIQGLTQEAGLSQGFVGMIILPFLSNDYTSIFVALKDKMDMSLTLTLERCMQTALMVVPLTILIAWGMRIDNMTLEFDAFSTAALFASIILVTYVMLEGKSNWLVKPQKKGPYLILQRPRFNRASMLTY